MVQELGRGRGKLKERLGLKLLRRGGLPVPAMVAKVKGVEEKPSLTLTEEERRRDWMW